MKTKDKKVINIIFISIILIIALVIIANTNFYIGVYDAH